MYIYVDAARGDDPTKQHTASFISFGFSFSVVLMHLLRLLNLDKLIAKKKKKGNFNNLIN